jgi:hypothetical protein
MFNMLVINEIRRANGRNWVIEIGWGSDYHRDALQAFLSCELSQKMVWKQTNVSNR